MNENNLAETDDYTLEITKHAFCEFLYKIGHQGNIVLINFIKVARKKEDAEDNISNNGDYGVSIEVKLRWSGCRCLDLWRS